LILLAPLLAAVQPAPAATAPAEPAKHAVMIGGSISNADYPRAAVRAREQGSTIIGFTVNQRGRAGDCRLVQSSGSMLLDRQVCGIVTKRFRFRPAQDAAGWAVPEAFAVQFDWSLPGNIRVKGPIPLSQVRTSETAAP
jgi:periplasmic protein TonB